MVQTALFGVLALAAAAIGETFPPYYANLTFLPPRTLSNSSDLTVKTRTGTFIGMLNDTYPNVRQFLRVPFAQPPIGDLRWLPPQKLANSSKRIDSTYYGPACPQYDVGTAYLYNEYAPNSLLLSVDESPDQGSVAWSSSEDCLSLAVWTPSHINTSLPVALFVTGGGGTTGGINIPSQLPSEWVSRSQEHIVVTINYRVNIFGNPKSRALNDTSLSLLDVRAAVEWVSENIQAFGGDPENIMLWGQSQGAGLTHLYTLAFPEDPRVKSFGMISVPYDFVMDQEEVNDDPYEDFDIVAKSLGCNYGDDAEAELECMRHISWVEIEEYINRYSATPSIAFNLYIPDEKYIFLNETERYLTGKVAKGPAVRSNAAREGASTNTTEVLITQEQWSCLTLSDTKLRKSLGLDTYRYYWAGNFTNISPQPWMGAYHWSDLLMIFGSYATSAGNISQLEVETSEKMQDYLLAFLKDSSTVNTTVGWPVFDPDAENGGTIAEFGKEVTVKNVTGDYIDAVCYNSSASARIDG